MTNLYKHKFITFGSHNNYIDAGQRLVKQAKELNIFTEIILYTADDLKKDVDFWNKHNIFIKNNRRGYGYWLWKSYIIKKTMENMNDGDILLYLDCGCEIDYKKKEDLIKHINLVKTNKIIYTTTGGKEKDWNKMDLIVKLDMKKDIYLDTKQHQAGVLLFLVCDETRKFVNEWYKIGCDYHNIDDSPSMISNVPSFREHRHDQSIFSLLLKKYKLCNNYNLRSSINIARNKSGVSKI